MTSKFTNLNGEHKSLFNYVFYYLIIKINIDSTIFFLMGNIIISLSFLI